MFFNRHVKQGKEIGQNTLQMLSSATMATKFDKMGKFYPTEEFFSDPYIAGFLTNFIGFTIVFGLGGGSWSSTKKGECIISAFAEIDPYHKLRKILIGDLVVDGDLHKAGANDGATACGVMFHKLKSTDQDPKYLEAKALAEDMQSFNTGATFQENMSSAVIIVTLRNYIQKKWGE